MHSQTGTSSGRTGCATGQTVNSSGERGGQCGRHKYDKWMVKDTVFNLLSRMQAVVFILISTCLLGMELIPYIKFLAHNTGLKLSQLEGRLAGNGCSLRSKFPHQEIHRWIEGRARMFFCRVAEIPVLIDGTVQSIDEETLVLKVHGVQEPCNELLPLTVQALWSWVDINRQVTAVKSPLMVKHREGEISEAPVSKLYPRLMQNGVFEFYMVLISAVFV